MSFDSNTNTVLTNPLLDHTPRALQWLALVVITLIFTAQLEWFYIPAALLLGPMFAGIVSQKLGAQVRLPRASMYVSQAVIGCLVARSVDSQIIQVFVSQWPLLIAIIAMTLIASIALGWVIGRLGILPGTTAIWGLLPGAASAMVMMAKDFGADPRLVAFMQYLRVLMVTVTAALVARYWANIASHPSHLLHWLAPVHWPAFMLTMGVIVLSLSATLIPRISGGVLLLAMFLGGYVQLEGYFRLELPTWLLAVAFALIGWSVGLRFTKDVLKVAAKALPQTVLSIAVLIIFCMCTAVLLTHLAHIDPLSAYLGTNPGGVDSAAIIAASAQVNIAFVMALQITRFLITLIIGPLLSRFIVNLNAHRAQS